MNVERGLRAVRGDVGANHHSPVLWAAIFGVFVLALGLPCSVAAERVSTLGRYQGYSEAVYDGWARTSQYVTVRDGTRIAIDIFRPTNKGVLHEEPLPAVWEHRRYQRAGWFDMYPRDMLLWFCNLDNPKKIAIGPWNHYQSHGVDRGTEMLRWFDYWLKDIDNGIMDEPPIVYCVMDAPGDRMIRWAHQWPLPQARPRKYYFSGGPSRSIDSVNDGLLGRSVPESGFDFYTVDYTTTSGSKTRWMPGPPQYPDMAANDRKALTYTTEPLAGAVEIVGHPVVHLWLQCPVDDIDVFAYLEDVDPAGRSAYITDGCLRASHRTLSPAPYDRIGLPYSRSFEQDVTMLSDEPVELVFDLLPTAQHFKAGHRIRIAVTCADKDSYRHIRRDSAPTIRLLRDAQHGSRVILPVIE